MTFPPPGEPVIECGHILIDTHSRQSRHAERPPRAEASAPDAPGSFFRAAVAGERRGSGESRGLPAVELPEFRHWPSRAAAVTGPMPGTDIRMR